MTEPEQKTPSDNIELYSPLDRRLARFLIHQEENPLDKQIEELRKTVEHFGENLAAHIQECHELRTADLALARSTEARLVNLEAGGSKGRKSTPPPPVSASILPPMRSIEDSTHDLRIDVDTVKKAALDGAERAGTTPDEEVEKVLERIIERKKNDAKLAEFEAKAAQAVAEAKQAVEEAQKRAADRRKLGGQVLLAFASGGGLWELLRSLITHAHH